jgi:hypothetical protein
MRMSIVLSALLGGIFAPGSDVLSSDRFDPHFALGLDLPRSALNPRSPQFVPNSLRFWDFSKNWTTNYGPAYRDTVEAIENLVPCTGRYALCFHSGPEPFPCEPDRRGRFANCKCTVEEGINYVLISAILNYEVYLDTIEVCGVDGSDCFDVPDKAPVCTAIAEGKLIPGADLISTFSEDVQSDFETALTNEPDGPDPTPCPKGPYAGCMTAPCRETRAGDATCSCPVFWGPFQLTGPDAQCTLDDGLVNSASYSPVLDKLLSETSGGVAQ